MEAKTIKLMCKDNKEIELSAEFQNLSPVLQDTEEDQVIPCPQIDIETMKFIKQFLESHNYKAENIIIKKPLVNDKLQDNVDEQTFQQFKNYQGIDNVEKIKPLVEAAYYFQFQQLKDACLVCLACEFYVGPTEADLEQFKTKNGLTNLQPDQELDIMKEYEPVFQKLNEKFKEEMEKEQKKFEESMATNEESKQ